MKALVPPILVAIFLCAAATNLFGGPLKSEIVGAGEQKDIDVPEGVFFKIRSFSQDGGTDRAVVTVTIAGQGATKVLSAARIDTATEATPTASPSATTGPTQATPTPTPSPTPTPTPVPTTQEPMNSVIIAGPATVTITAGDVAAFITYKKDKNSFD